MEYKKKYNEALSRARSMYESRDDAELAAYIFPELAESEDERIRKCIGIALTDVDERRFKDFGTTLKDCIAWLEKQKEPHYTKRNALFDKCVENCDPKTVEEVNKRVDDIMNMPELSAFEQALTNFIGYWEDDEERWPSQFVKKHGKHILDMAREELQKEQKPVEWSEADEKTIDDAYGWLCEYAGSLMQRNYGKSSMLYGIADKLKSLRPSWKPSEEQMNAFRGYIEDFQARADAAVGGWNNFDVMIRLYDQLKKLM